MRSVATAAVLCAAAAAGTAPSYGVCWTRNKLNASGAKLTRACVPRTVNGTGQAHTEVCERLRMAGPWPEEHKPGTALEIDALAPNARAGLHCKNTQGQANHAPDTSHDAWSHRRHT